MPTLFSDRIEQRNRTPSSAGFFVMLEGADVSFRVKDKQVDNSLDPGASPGDGDKYWITDSTSLHANFGSISGLANNDIVRYDIVAGAFVVYIDVSLTANFDGSFMYLEDDDVLYYLKAGVWTGADTNTTYSAGNGISLSTTTFAVAGGTGLAQESSGLALDDPINLSQLTESTDATDDKILLWDESGDVWKYMTLDDLQDSIDTGGGGGEANEDSFKTISVSGQDNVVADADDDTLTFAAAGGITLTTTAASDTVTISSADTNTFRTVTAGGNTLSVSETLAFTAGTGISIAESAGAVTITNSVSDTNTWRTVTAGGNTLSTSETLAFTAGTGVSITESAGAVTIASTVTDTNTFRTVTAGGNTLGGGETLAFTAGTGVSIAESAGAVTITNTVSDTNTTYSPGTLLDVSGTTFNVDLSEAGAATIANGDYILFLDGGATSAAAKGNITDVATLFAGAGMTASASVLNVIGGDGITANADEIEATVDGSTIELSASDGSGTIRVKDNGVTLAKMAGLTRGSIIYGDASGDPAALVKGANNEVLTSDGTDISWEAASGGGVSLSGSTNNTVATVTGSNALIGEANLTFDGNSLAITSGSASTIACTITAAGSQTADLLVVENSSNVDLLKVMSDGDLELGFAGTGIIRRGNASGPNVAGGGVHLRGGKSTGNALGGEVRFYTSPAGSSGEGVNNHAEAVVIDGNKVVDFKIAGGAKTVTLQNDAMDLYMMGGATVTVNATEWLQIKVNGNTRYIPVWS